jgi:acetolactate synthase-1/2/3 large subunit
MGLGAYPASGEKWIGMLGMHGLYEANLAMHGCDLMINVGARFDDRITGRIADFSPNPQGAYRHRPVLHQQGDPRRFPDHR